MAERSLQFRAHAIQRMFERSISIGDIRTVIEAGEVIEECLDDTPYPSALYLGRAANRSLHVVAANNPEDGATIVITVYEPDPQRWDSGFRRRL